MRKKIFMILIAGVLSLSFLFQANRNLSAATPMPRFNLVDAESGEMVNSVSFEGKAKLVIFFATWCPPCMREVPILKQLQEEYGHDEFAVVALSVDRRRADVQRFLKRSEVNYPVLMADRAVVQNFGGIPGVPVTFLVSKEGNVLRKYPGMVPHQILEREVKKMLAE
jgi:thiol-disulfide isomerase/thioredoxin